VRREDRHIGHSIAELKAAYVITELIEAFEILRQRYERGEIDKQGVRDAQA